MMRKRRCAIYTRQSSVSGQRETSCNAQFEKCLQFVQSMKMEGWVWVGTRFDDPGYSGATLERPALQKLIQSVEAGELDIIVVEYLDRLSRSVYETLTLLESFRAHEVEVRIVTCPELTLSPSDNFMINLLASFAEFERGIIKELIREARAILKSHGRRVGGAVPYGYDADPYTKQLIVNPEEADHVKSFFGWAAEGLPPSQIAERANERGWRTKQRIAARSGRKTGGNRWTARQILASLSNLTYLGKIQDGEETREGVHDAIVSEALFVSVRGILEARRTREPGRTDTSHRWPLKGRIRCGQCMRGMSPHTIRHGSKIYRYYRCRSQAAGRPPCPNVQVPAYEMEKFVLQALSNLDRNDATDHREEVLSFLEVWSLLSADVQRQLMPELVSEVFYESTVGKISVTLNRDALLSHTRSVSDQLQTS